MHKKKIWIMNHYATNMYFNKGGRHYWFAEKLIEEGYEPTIFCANTRHNSDEVIKILKGKYVINVMENISYVFIKTINYKGNNIKRILNMFSFYRNLIPVSKEYAKIYGKPDIILASSVHPLTLLAGIKIAKKFGIPCICEIRDLWPESIVAYGFLKRTSVIAKILYKVEKWIYKKADKLVFTMEGGKDYIANQGWDKENGGTIDLSKVYHINNGVDLGAFDNNKKRYKIIDRDLEDVNSFKVVYAGSIRLVNNVKKIIDAAQVIKEKGYTNIKFMIYGEGTEKEHLEKYCNENKINNVTFKGFVNKKYIPYILSKCNLNILHFEQNSLKKYGASLNKMFEYFASGRPTVSDCEFGYDLIKKYKCGIVVDNANAEQLSQAIVKFYEMPENEYNVYCKNAINAAKDYDYKVLTQKLIELF